MSAPLSKEEAYARLGSITREMHEALTVLGNNQLHSIVEEIPNARERLIYVGKMTEEAANKVLTLVETAKPACDELAAGASALEQSLEQTAAMDIGAELVDTQLGICVKFAGHTADIARRQGEVLSDIMMAQDFQDLSGQVIKRVIDIITRTEIQLVQLLIDSAPDVTAPELTIETHQLEGPQTEDKALKQDDVDDLLASLGF